MKTAPPDLIVLKNIRLRRYRTSDVDSIYEYGTSLEVAKYANWSVRSGKESLIESIAERTVNWDLGIEYSWVITLIDQDKAIGGVSAFINPPDSEIGYLIHQEYWGMGIATEATQAVVDLLADSGQIEVVRASCDTENTASIRVLGKLGFKLIRTEIGSTVRPQISNIPRDTHLFEYRR